MASTITAPIVEWKRDKGYGFLQVGTQRIFLHHRNFSRRLKVPEVGDVLRFRIATDELGRTFASKAVHVSDAFDWKNEGARTASGLRGRISLWPLVILAGLLVLPALALRRLPVDHLLVEFGVVGISFLTFYVHVHDKKQARTRGWRISEFTLHFLELIGGWPGAFLGQRWLRHKTSKFAYQIGFWLIVAAYQLAAVDCLLEGRLRQGVTAWMQAQGARPM